MITDVIETTIHNVTDLRIGVDAEKRNPCIIIDTGAGKHFIHLSPSDPFKAARMLRTVNAFNAVVSEEVG